MLNKKFKEPLQTWPKYNKWLEVEDNEPHHTIYAAPPVKHPYQEWHSQNKNTDCSLPLGKIGWWPPASGTVKRHSYEFLHPNKVHIHELEKD